MKLPGWVYAIGVGLVLGGVTVWTVTLSILSHERATQLHWRDSTTAIFAADTARSNLSRHKLSLVADSLRKEATRILMQATLAHDSALVARKASEVARGKLKEAHTVADGLLAVPEIAERDATTIVALERENDQLRGLVEVQNTEVSRLRLLIIQDSVAIALRDTRITALDSVVRQPAPRPKLLFGFLKPPSRPVVFVAGVIAGVALTKRVF